MDELKFGVSRNKALFEAVERGNLESIKEILKSGANINCVSPSINPNEIVSAEDLERLTPLHLATKQGHLCIVEYLIKHGACIDSVSSMLRYTPLHYACVNGSFEIVGLLLSKGAKINVDAKDHVTPLHLATKRGHENVVKFLLENGAEIERIDCHGNTTKYSAVKSGGWLIIDNVLKYNHRSSIGSNRYTFQLAVQSLKEEEQANVKTLLDYWYTVSPVESKWVVDKDRLSGIKPSKISHQKSRGRRVLKLLFDSLKFYIDGGMSALQCATKFKKIQIAEFLIKSGANINAENLNGDTAIHFAIENCDLQMLKLLLSNGAKVKNKPKIFHFAVAKGSIEIVEELLKHDIDVNACNQFGRTALHFTVQAKDSNGDIVKLLLSRGADIEAQSLLKTTTLYDAIVRGQEKIVETLLEYNAKLECNFQDGTTLFHVAAEQQNPAIIQMILNKGFDVNATKDNGGTALHIATYKGHRDVVKLLLESGAKADLKMENGLTALHLLKFDDPEMIVLLLKFGADINARDEEGRTPLHIASYYGFQKSVQTLLEHGSNINEKCLKGFTPLQYALKRTNKKNNDIYGPHVFKDDYKGDEGDEYRKFIETSKYLMRHIAKMHVANFYINGEDLYFAKNSNFFWRDEEKNKNEILFMKNEIIPNTTISFYDILTKDDKILANYAKNENIIQALKSDDFEMKFPIYAVLLKSQLQKGVARNEFLNKSINACYIIFQDLPGLSDICTDRLFSYLSSQDLRNLIDSCKHLNN